MAFLKGGTTVSGDLQVAGLVRSEDGFATFDHAVVLIADSITSRANKVVKFSAETEHLALSLIYDNGTTITMGTEVALHAVELKSAVRLYDTDTSHYITLTAGARTTQGTFTFPNVSAGTVATINNAATWTAAQTHSANIIMSSTAELAGNAQTATKLKTARALNSVDFDGTAAITVPVNVAIAAVDDPSHYILFASNTSGNLQAKAAAALTFDPANGTLHATAIEANLVGTGVAADNANNLTGGSSFTVPYQSSAAQDDNPLYKQTVYVPANITTTRKFLMMTGTGTAGTAPTWDTLGTISGDSATWEANTIQVSYGGTGLTTFAANTIYKGNGTNALAASNITDNGSTVMIAQHKNFTMPSGTGTFAQTYTSTAATTSFAAYHSGTKSGSFTAFNFSNTATSGTASAIKSSLFVTSEGAWSGSAAQNRGIYSRATGGTVNYSFYGDAGVLFNKEAVQIGLNGFAVSYNGATQSLDFDFLG